jgi:hypothetical protein
MGLTLPLEEALGERKNPGLWALGDHRTLGVPVWEFHFILWAAYKSTSISS